MILASALSRRCSNGSEVSVARIWTTGSPPAVRRLPGPWTGRLRRAAFLPAEPDRSSGLASAASLKESTFSPGPVLLGDGKVPAVGDERPATPTATAVAAGHRHFPDPVCLWRITASSPC